MGCAARVISWSRLLLTICPVPRPPPMMRHRDDPKFLSGNLIDDAVGKSPEKTAAPAAAKDCSEIGICQNEICGSLKLGHERKSETDIRSRRIKGRSIMQLGEREWDNDEIHFNAART